MSFTDESAQRHTVVRDTILEFDWDDYGLDEVQICEYKDYADELALKILEKIAKFEATWKMLEGTG